MKDIRKILIANRGEIAVRIIRTAREMDIKTVAIYSDADLNSLHTLMADEKVYIGSSLPEKSYLAIDKIVDVAEQYGVDAVHPGYGFLAQNPKFIKALEEKGIIFIGPSSKVQKIVGNKLGARKLFHSQGIPVAPGTFEPVNINDVEGIAEEIGYPVIVKPAGGGGGIGMSIVWEEKDLKKSFKRAEDLSKSAFGVKEVYVEKYFPDARHIEVQILADKFGNVIHLFERECSVQRRFQKVLEETPSPALNKDLQERLYKLAVKAAKICGYTNAGTFEFIYSPNNREFYFLEVNSRIQVEHPITEMVTGIDIVREQINIAEGLSLRFRQNEIVRKGHSIEARIYAEDPLNNFMPSIGVIKRLWIPSGPWVRVDSGVYEGVEVTSFYDPLLFKVIVWGDSRRVAIKRMLRVLDETIVEGVTTNIYLHKVVLNDEQFVKGEYNTNFIAKRDIIKKIESIDKKPKLRIPRRKEKKRTETKEVDLWRIVSRFDIG